MKIKQLLLLSILLSTSTTWTMGNARAQFFKWVPRLARTTAFVGGCAIPTSIYIKSAYDNKKCAEDPKCRDSWFKEQIQVSTQTDEIISVKTYPKYLDTPEIVKNYVAKKLQEHYTNPAEMPTEGTVIMILIDQFGTAGKDNVQARVDTKGPTGIIFGPQRINELFEALEIINQSNVDSITMAKAQAIVALNNATLNHEIGHLKDHYMRYVPYYQTMMPLTTYASLQLIKAASQKILKTPKNIPGLLLSCMAIVPSIYTQWALIINLRTAYHRMLENNADDYACRTTKDPESLRRFADDLKNNDIEYFKKRGSVLANMEDDLNDYTKLPLYKKIRIQAYFFYTLYKNDIPSNHPIGAKRAAKLRKAAQELEDKQKQEKN